MYNICKSSEYFLKVRGSHMIYIIHIYSYMIHIHIWHVYEQLAANEVIAFIEKNFTISVCFTVLSLMFSTLLIVYMNIWSLLPG